ncbi:hypothetical protein [Pyrococcus yayanosii]|uniref:Uncharacterized protein n=1 Tax=Pyrococcus yayanosii (strain CH1 / JCM 16557) TaxID=529709 RepID=F8AG46_PYRYC|nr:hypothetical protein [Pyrococcus yayanosii]AEH25103.1 hypothetical protein PYCH_14330 [Pyrococcus yayanosii CH1]
MSSEVSREFWEFVASEVRKAREAEARELEVLRRELEREILEARRKREYFLIKQDMEEYFYWDGYLGALLTVKGLLRKFGILRG